MIALGKYNTLTVVREVGFGVYLSDGTGNEVLLPKQYIPEGSEIGQDIEVFIYRDSEDRLTATTLTPKVQVHEFAYLQVKQSDRFGTFMDWGLPKDLLVPLREQAEQMPEGSWHIVYVFMDIRTNRLAASCNLENFLDNENLTVEAGDAVDLLVVRDTDLGPKVIVNQAHWGLLYQNEVFKPLKTGDRLKGYVKKVRPDNNLDISLNPEGYDKVAPHVEQLLEAIQNNGGFLDLTDKSAPEDIYNRLQMSKKVFKQAVGALFKQRLIKIESDGLRLN